MTIPIPIIAATICCCIASWATASPTVLIVVGAPGTEAYREQFQTWADNWRSAAQTAGATVALVGENDEGERMDRELLRARIAAEPVEADEPLWIVFIGHGTFDGHQAKFNLRDADVTAEQLSDWLLPLKRPLVIINCASSSAPFINRLSGGNRVLVTATKSGYQYNFARFGQYFATAIADSAADLDKDEQVSVLEAFLSASASVREFYKQEARLATEEALLDDNGDRAGTPASWFRGVRAIKTGEDGAKPDGRRANQIFLITGEWERAIPPERRQRRDTLLLQVEDMRGLKAELGEEEYYRRLEALLVELALLYE